MKLILFGATGMVGAGALREALNAPEVESVLTIGRHPCGVAHPKLRELLLPDLFDFSAVEQQLVGYDACIWAVGISSMGLDEAAYARVTEWEPNERFVYFYAYTCLKIAKQLCSMRGLRPRPEGEEQARQVALMLDQGIGSPPNAQRAKLSSKFATMIMDDPNRTS